jgi:hypothetical protein
MPDHGAWRRPDHLIAPAGSTFDAAGAHGERGVLRQGG